MCVCYLIFFVRNKCLIIKNLHKSIYSLGFVIYLSSNISHPITKYGLGFRYIKLWFSMFFGNFEDAVTFCWKLYEQKKQESCISRIVMKIQQFHYALFNMYNCIQLLQTKSHIWLKQRINKLAMSSNRTLIQNKEQGSYYLTMEITCHTK